MHICASMGYDGKGEDGEILVALVGWNALLNMGILMLIFVVITLIAIKKLTPPVEHQSTHH